MFDPNDLLHNPEKAVFEFRKKEHAFFDQNLITGLADAFMEMWPDWRHRYLDGEHDTVHIEYVFKVIGDNHPCKALPKIYQYLYTCREKDTELSQLEEIATEAEEYLKRLEEYDRKYDVEFWDEIDFAEKGLGNRFNTARAAAEEAAAICYREIGNYYTRNGSPDTGIEYYRKAAETDHEPESVYKLLKHLTDNDELEEAGRWCSSTMYAYLAWTDIRFKKIKSLVHYRLEEYDDCIGEINDILEIEDSVETRALLEQVIQERESAE